MRSKGLIFVASLCLVAIVAAAIAPTAGDPTHAVLDSVVAVLSAPAFVRSPSIGFDLGAPDRPLVRGVPARAPPLA